jgi:hypothetical protein
MMGTSVASSSSSRSLLSNTSPDTIRAGLRGPGSSEGVQKLNIASTGGGGGGAASDSATSPCTVSSSTPRSKKASRTSNTLSTSDQEDSEDVRGRRAGDKTGSGSTMASLKAEADSDILGGSHSEEEHDKEVKRKSKSTRSPATPPKTPRKSAVPDSIAALSPGGLHYSAPSIPSPSKHRPRNNDGPDEEASGSATVGSSSLDSSSAEGSILKRVDLGLFHTGNEASFESEDDDIVQTWKEQESNAHTMAIQLLAVSGLAIANNLHPFSAPHSGHAAPSSTHRSTDPSPPTPGLRNNVLSQSDIISSSNRAQSWAPSASRTKTSRSRPIRRQIIMLDGEAPPKAKDPGTINSSKISHLTIDHLIHLLANTQLSQDKNFLDTLILAHDYFIKSPDLLAVLIQIYRSSQMPEDNDDASPSNKQNSVSPSNSNPTISVGSANGPSSSLDSMDSPKSANSESSETTREVKDLALPSIHESSTPPASPSSSPPSPSPYNSSRHPRMLKPHDRSISDLMDTVTSNTSSGSSANLLPSTTLSASSASLLGGASVSDDMVNAMKRMRTINILKKLIEMRFYNLRKSRTFASLLQRFVIELLTSPHENENRFGDVLKAAMKTNAAFVREDDAAEMPAPAPVLQEKYSSTNITSIRYKSASARKSLDDFSPVEIARQITLIDFVNWNSIPLSEFAHAAFNAKDAATKCPRITICTGRFNDLAQWVSSTVVLAAKKKHRVAVLTKFIQVMDELRRLQNFHALMAFYSALNQSAILRLRKTWKGVSSRVMVLFNGINKFFDNSQDFKVYREYIKSADPPCIPYIGFILGGLTFVEEFPTFIVEEVPEGSERPERKKKRSSTKPASSAIASKDKETRAVERAERGDPKSKSAHRDSPERGGSSTKVQSYKVRTPSNPRSRDQSDSAAAADTETSEQDPRSRRSHELDNSAATSSDAGLSDFPSPRASSGSFSRGISNPSFNGCTSAEPLSSDSDDSAVSNSSDDDNTKLRRVLREPIPQTVVASEPKRSHASGSSTTSSLSQSAIVPGSTNATTHAIMRAKRSKTRLTGEPLTPGQQFLNWRKMVMISKSFGDVLRFQRTRYDLVIVKEIEKFVSDLRQHSWFLDAEELASMSQEIEAEQPESSSVRDTFTAVKDTISSAVLPSPDGKKKDKGKKDKNKARPTFNDLLTDQILFSEFRKFLLAQYSHENLLFWEAVNKFKQIDLSQPQSKIKAMANDIYGKFITGTSDDGTFTIGFSHDIKESVTRKMNSNDFEPSMFDSALQEVEHSLLKPSFGQFLNETLK